MLKKIIFNFRLEDGTVSFLDIIALKYGFKAIQDIGGKYL